MAVTLPKASVPSAGNGSFDAYVRTSSNDLLWTAFLITRNWDDARDAVQDALVRLYRRWDRLPTGDQLRGYAYRTVVNTSLVVTKGRRARPVADPALLPAAPTGPDVAVGVTNAETAWRLCGELPPAQRAAVVLRFQRDLGYAEIAAALGCSEPTARSHVHRALATLRARLVGGDDHD